ncbi:MAG: Eco47II family restriction endonuclease [Muribaculaceae bacterium]|nr:Eco47II family restriction endonuclease [Muribaculaceae bacterium]
MRQYRLGVISDTDIYEYVKTSSIGGWTINNEGFDIANPSKGVYAILQHSPVTMNSERCRLHYLLMQSKLLEDRHALCYLIDMNANTPKDEVWKITLEGKSYSHNRIRRISAEGFCRSILQ